MAETLSLPTRARTRSLAQRLARSLVGRDLLLLEGDLGAGKTAFTRYLAEALGIAPSWVSSPSFTLVQRYPEGEAGLAVIHVDLYRCAGFSDLEALGLEEALASNDLVVVEWPGAGERLWRSSGRPLWRLAFQGTGKSRRVVVEGPGRLTPGTPR
ncbi:MAG: tRNA (adenosine(37)-N6)-threonylcarbamoyltransferase complex ATPase subunit type 1 TsaE [Acidobacteriota bacterium]